MDVLPNDTASRIFALLESLDIEAYAVGGYVRDVLMRRTPSDLDIAVSTPPWETKRRLEPFVRVVDTGMRFGTVTAIIDSVPFELTTFRSDIGIGDGRHPANISFVGSITSDLARRDFTVNAMAWSPRNGLIDCFGGRNDIEKRLIRCVGCPATRFREDALRIMRALRFASVLSFSVEDETSKAIFEYAETLPSLSAERIYSELKKLVCGDNAVHIIKTYKKVLQSAIPRLCAAKINTLDYLPKDDTAARLATLFATRDDAETAMKALKAPRSISSKVLRLHSFSKLPTTAADIKRLGLDNDPQLLYEAAVIFENREAAKAIKQIMSQNGFITAAELDISIEKLLSLGVKNGPQLGRSLRLLSVAVAEGKCRNHCDELERYLLSHIGEIK